MRHLRRSPLSPGLGSEPLIEIKGLEDGGVRLECTSAGWYPEPHATWRGPYGEIVPALAEAYTADADGLFRVSVAVIVRDCSVRNMSCSVNNTLLGQEKDTVIFIPGWSLALWSRASQPAGRGLVLVRGLLGTGPHGRSGVAGEQVKFRLCLQSSSVPASPPQLIVAGAPGPGAKELALLLLWRLPEWRRDAQLGEWGGQKGPEP